MRDFALALVVLGIGGAIFYVLYERSKAAPPLPPPSSMGQCGASYAGVGASVPCELVGKGVKEAWNYVANSGVGTELKAAYSGIKPWEVYALPVASTHAIYNEGKRLLDKIF